MGGGGSTTTKQQLDPMLKPYVEFALSQGKQQYQQATGPGGYQAYPGQTVAGFNPDTQQYFSGVRGLTAGSDTLKTATDTAKAAGMGYTGTTAQYDPTQFSGNVISGEDINRYMNPFTEDVIKRQAASTAQQRDEAAAALRTRQASAGALGNSRAAVESVLANQKYNEMMADNEAELRMRGFDQATSTALAQQNALNQAARDTELSRQFGAGFEEAGAQNRAEYGLQQARDLSNLSATERQQEMERLAALKGIGSQQQLLEQAQLEDAYKRFVEARDWNKNQLADFASIAYGAPHGSTTTTSQSSSPWSSILGAGLFAAGLPTAGGGSMLGSMFGFKDGGIMDVERIMKAQQK
jgi:hypothetical protein